MDPVYKMYPPLRSPDDVDALRAGLVDGTIDAIGTDHAPHAAFEKDVTFEEAPRGVVGLETAASVVRAAVDLDQDAFFERMAIAPARVLGETAGPLTVGSSDLVVFDPGEEWTFDRPRSKSANSPWLGRALTGKVTHVFTRSGLVSPTGEGDS